MLWIDWRLALVTFSLMPVLLIVATYFRLNARDAYREVRRRLARLNGFLQESLQGMTVSSSSCASATSVSDSAGSIPNTGRRSSARRDGRPRSMR